MLPFHWGLLVGVALFVACAHGATINSPASEDDVEELDEAQRAKRSYKRGQTQSQYLNFGQPELDGKAEAEATESGSRSTVAGTHGMGQAQSQFSSGDCSGCGVTGPVYEYSTGSPDPLTLGGNVLPYIEGKPSSIIGGVFGADRRGPGGGFIPGSGISSGQPGLSGGFTPTSTAPGAGGSFRPGVGGPGSDDSFAPGTSGAGQIGRPGPVGPYAPGMSFAPGTSGAGQMGRPGADGSYAPGISFAPGTSGAGQIGRPGAGGSYAPGGSFAPGTSGAGQLGRPGAESAYGPGGTYTPGASGQIGRPGTGGAYMPGSGYAPGTSAAGQTAKPGTGVAYAPGSGYSPGSADAGQGGRPSAGGVYAPGVAGVGQTGRPGTGDVYAPGSVYSPATPGVGQTGRPGDDYSPGTVYSPGTPGVGQAGRPSDHYAPGSVYSPGTSGMGQPGGPGDVYAPGTVYSPGTSGMGQTGRPGDHYAPGTVYSPGTYGVGQTGRPGDAYAPGGGYVPGTSTTGQIARPGSGTGYLPGGESQEGRPGAATPYAPAGGYAPGTDIAGQPGIPGAGGAYAPGAQYAPGTPGLGQMGRPSTGGVYAPGSGYAPGTSIAGQTGAGGSYAPQGMGQVGAPGTSFGYSPIGGSGGVGQPGTPGFVKPGIAGTGPQALGQDQPPHLVAPPGTPQGPQAGIGFGPQGQTYGRPGQQTPIYTPGAGYTVPGGGKQQAPQYAPGSQPASYGVDGVSGRPGSQFISYGQPGQQIPGQKIAQPGSYYGQPAGFAPGTGQQIGGQPQQPGYGPSYTGQTGGTVGPARPGTQYGVTGPQEILQQPGQGMVSRPGAGGMQVGVGGAGQRQSGYQGQPGVYGQPGMGGQVGVGYQPVGGFGPVGIAGQQGTAAQQGGVTGVYQPGYDQRTGGYMPPGFSQTGSVPQASGLQPPQLGRQPGSMAAVPGTSLSQPGTITQQGAGMAHGQQGSFTHPAGSQPSFDQRGAVYPPSTGSFIPGVSKPAPDMQQVTSGFPQVPGYTPGYGPQGQPGTGGSYTHGTQPVAGYRPQITGQPAPGQPTGIQPGVDFGQYPGGGFPQPGALPGGGGAGGTHQGSGFGTGYDTSYGQQPGGQPGGGYGQIGGAPQYRHPGAAGSQLPGSPVSQYGQGPQTIVQPSGGPVSGVVVGGAEDAFSQAESSIGNGQAAASAQGKKNGGTAKTQVQGTYSSSGSFSASAMTSDNDRSASSQVTGGVEGAMSQSQGQGGAAQSQAQVQVNEKTGGTKASSQSGGIIHQSQSEVQANDKGGLADAQSSGPGQTSSQAQIGFRPGQDGEIVRSAGGGQASAQSGAHSGNSQSQIHGTSKYGVSYHGAAQSASGTKEQVATYREQNRDLFNTISQFGGTDAVTDRVDTVYNPSLTSESDIPDLQLKASRTNKEATNSNKLDDDSTLTEEEEEEEPYDEYEDEEDYYNENPIKMDSKPSDDKKLETSSLYRTHTQTSPMQTQQVAVADPSKKYNVVQNQNGRVQTYSSRTTTETVPNGFRGTVNVEKKFHTKSLEPHKSESKLNITADEKSGHKPRTPDSFVTVTKSITGSMDNSKNPPQDNKNFQSTYYTKSSTCGYFTFSCNIVYGANGRSKICRPKAPTNGKC